MGSTNQERNGVTFGKSLTYSSIWQVAYHRSDDKKAFPITLPTALAAGVGTPVYGGLSLIGAPVDTRIYSAVIPTTGKDLMTTFVLNGFGSTDPGTNTKVVLRVNNQHSVTHFGPSVDQAFTVTMPLRAESAADIRIAVLVVAERDSTHPDGNALIALNNISADARVADG
ncbi:MAG TPA: hypothetical protein VKD90_06660 [Gemmataceae bacterium]|nr:hypothetical protein [Gemmataceae bacterium]